MSKPIILRPDAEVDVERAFRWYEKQDPGLGTELIRAVDACLALIERKPDLYPLHYRKARRALLRRFPYAIMYVVQDEHIDVVACSHTRRNPRRWRSRLK